MTKKEINITRSYSHLDRGELVWGKKEQEGLELRILDLRDDQIGALAALLVGFGKEDIEDVVKDIRQNGRESGHLPILIFEPKSKEDLLWWLDYFEKENKNQPK